MQKAVKMPLKGKTSGNGQMARISRIFMILFLKRKLYDHYSQIEVECLQDHWSSGFISSPEPLVSQDELIGWP